MRGFIARLMGVGCHWLLPLGLDDTHSAGSVLYNGHPPWRVGNWGTEAGSPAGLPLFSL